MSFRVTADVLDFAPYSKGPLVILICMASWANDDGGRIFPRIETLAEKARMSVRRTQSALREFEKAGLIECVRKNGGRHGEAGAHEYKINVEKLRLMDRSKYDDRDKDGDPDGVTKLHPTRRGDVSDKVGCNFGQNGMTFEASRGDISGTPVDNQSINPSNKQSHTLPIGNETGTDLLDLPAFLDRRPKARDEFAEFWRTFDPPLDANETKAKGAWNEVSPDRPAIDELLSKVRAYKSWLKKENEGRRAPRQPVSPARFLSERMWTRIDAGPDVRHGARGRPNWGGRGDQLAAMIGGAAFDAYFDGAVLEDGPPVVITVLSAFKQQAIVNRWQSAIDKVFGVGARVVHRQPAEASA